MIWRTFLKGIKLNHIYKFFVEGPGEVKIRTIVLFIEYSLVFKTFILLGLFGLIFQNMPEKAERRKEGDINW